MTKRDSIDTFHLFHDMYNSVCISYNIHNKQNSKKHTFMSGSCHLDRASIFEIGVECQIFLIVIFFTVAEYYNLGYIQGMYYKGALAQKRSAEKIKTNIQH